MLEMSEGGCVCEVMPHVGELLICVAGVTAPAFIYCYLVPRLHEGRSQEKEEGGRGGDL